MVQGQLLGHGILLEAAWGQNLSLAVKTLVFPGSFWRNSEYLVPQTLTQPSATEMLGANLSCSEGMREGKAELKLLSEGLDGSSCLPLLDPSPGVSRGGLHPTKVGIFSHVPSTAPRAPLMSLCLQQ